VALNLEQLGESTKSIYGATFAGHRYLKRFFDIEFKLPEPDHRLFAKSLLQSSPLQNSCDLFTGFNENNTIAGTTPVEAFEVFASYARFFGIGPRDQQQIMRTVEAVCIRGTQYHFHWLLFLAVLLHVSPQVFHKVTKTGGSLPYQSFGELVAPVRREEVYFTTYNVSGDGVDHTTTTLTEVAWIYYQNAWKNLTDLGPGGRPYEFPDNLVSKLLTERPNSVRRGRHYSSSVAEYAALVSYAGHFVA
jgi:hypothetical protein